ncbi:MAG: hypothetical protein V3R93_06090 [Candidatus Hydrothermarchaeaceae archaeon]
MRKIDEIREVIHFDPWYRLFSFPVTKNLFNLRFVTSYNFMTTHAFTDTRNTGNPRPRCIDMTIHAWYIVISGVYLVTKVDRLFRGCTGIVSTIHPIAYEKSYKHYEYK